jgi:hypothetical protein
MAKLFNNAGDKPILPSFPTPPIATAKPASSGGPQQADLVVWAAASAAHDEAQHKPASAWHRRFRCADKPLPLGEVRPSILLSLSPSGGDLSEYLVDPSDSGQLLRVVD